MKGASLKPRTERTGPDQNKFYMRVFITCAPRVLLTMEKVIVISSESSESDEGANVDDDLVAEKEFEFDNGYGATSSGKVRVNSVLGFSHL